MVQFDVCKFESGEVIVSAPVVSRGQAAHLLDAVEEQLHEIALAIDLYTETETLFAIGLCGMLAQHSRCLARLRFVSGSYALSARIVAPGGTSLSSFAAMGAPRA